MEFGRENFVKYLKIAATFTNSRHKWSLEPSDSFFIAAISLLTKFLFHRIKCLFLLPTMYTPSLQKAYN